MIIDRPEEQVKSLNNDQAVSNGNGTYTIVLSSSDPGMWNWIMTSKGGVGTAMCHIQGFRAGNTGNLDIRLWSHVVPLDSLASVLPQDTKWVSQQERDAQSRERLEKYDIAHNF